MDKLTIRPFSGDDLSAVVALWNRCLTKDPITVERFWHLFVLADDFDPKGALIAELDGKVVGFLQAMVRRVPLGSLGMDPHKGFITVFFVDPAFGRRGVGTALLDAGLAFLKAQGKTDVWVNGYAPVYIFPGVDDEYTEALGFLAKNGFTKFSSAVAMGMSLEGVSTPARVREREVELAAEGYEVRLFRREDTLKLMAFVEEHFAHWAPSMLDGLQHGNLEVLVSFLNGEVVGFTQWENTYNDPPKGASGRFGPFGVRPDLRSKGIGAVIFYKLIERVVGNGSRYLWFGWAGGRNLSFYERAGCKVTRSFQLFKKSI